MITKTRKRFRWAALIASCIVTFATDALAFDRVTVSIYQSVSDAGLYIANDRGYFRDRGIEVEFVQMDSVSSVVTGLASGQIDAAGGAPSAAIYNASQQGIGIRIVADKGSTPKGHGYLVLVVRKGLENTIKSPLDLRGRRVAWAGVGVGTTNEPALDHLLRGAGLKDDDLDLVNLSFGDSLAALALGSVDAAYLIEPLAQAAVQRDIGRIFLTGDQIYPDQQVAVLLFGSQLTQKRPDLGRRFMSAYLQGVRDYSNAFEKNIDRPAIIAILTKNTTVTRPELYETMVLPGLNPSGSLNIEGMKSDAEWFRSKGYIKQPIDVVSVIDETFVSDALKTLDPVKAP